MNDLVFLALIGVLTLTSVALIELCGRLMPAALPQSQSSTKRQ